MPAPLWQNEKVAESERSAFNHLFCFYLKYDLLERDIVPSPVKLYFLCFQAISWNLAFF